MPEAQSEKSEDITSKTSKSYSIKNVKIPEGPWCTLLEGAAYARVAYAAFTKAAREEQLPVYIAPATENGRRVHKADIDAWLSQTRWTPPKAQPRKGGE